MPTWLKTLLAAIIGGAATAAAQAVTATGKIDKSTAVAASAGALTVAAAYLKQSPVKR